MIEVLSKKTDFSENRPRVLTPQNVQFWSHHTQQFQHSQIHKAKKFLEHNCLEYVGESLFLCHNIPGYNTRTYTIKRRKSSGEFVCNCQKALREDGKCSHVLALYYGFKIGLFKRGVKDE